LNLGYRDINEIVLMMLAKACGIVVFGKPL